MELDIPIRDRGDRILDVIDDLPEAIDDPTEREVVRTVLTNELFGLEGRHSTIGPLLDDLAAEEQSGQLRARVDRARTECGLTPITEIERRQEFARATRWPPPPPPAPQRDENGAAIQKCPHCEAISMTSWGAPEPVRARRWHCPAHVHLAEDGDLDDFRLAIRFDEAGGIRLSEEAEEHYAKTYEQAVEQSRQRAEARAEQRRAEGERLAALEAIHRENVEPINVAGFSVNPVTGEVVE